MRRSWFLAISLLAFRICVLAAPATGGIEGTVSDPSGAVRGGADVLVRNTSTGLSREVRTDLTGHFAVRQLEMGTYELTINLSGFETLVRDVPVESGQVQKLVLPLTISKVRQEVVVSVPSQAATSTTQTVLSRETLEGEHAENMNDYLFQGVPSVSTSRRSNVGFSGPGAGFFIRGLTGTRVTVFVDDLPVQVNSHFHSRSDQYSPDLIDHMEVTRGPSAVLHGPGAVGGVIDIYTRTPRKGFSFLFQAEAGGMSSRELMGDAGYGWDGGNVLLSFLNWTTQAQVFGEDFDLHNINFKLTQSVTSAWKATLRLERAHEPSSNSTSPDPGFVIFKFRETLDTAALSLDHQTANSKSTAAFRLNRLNTSSFRESGARGRFLDIARYENESGAFLRHTWYRGVGSVLTVGTDLVTYSDDRTNGNGTAPFVKNELSYQSPFVWASQAVGARAKVEGGLRYTHSSDYRSNLAPEIGAIYDLTANLALRARGGKAFRLPRVDEVRAPFAKPNDSLQPEDFRHEEIGANKRFGNRAEFDADVWQMRGHNLIQTIGSGSAARAMNTGRFANHGVESTVRVGLTRELGVSFGAAVMKIDKSLSNVPQRTFDMGLDYRRLPWRGTMNVRYAAKNTTAALGDYTVADARGSYEITRRLSLLADVDNLTNEKYATITAFSGPIQQVPRTFFAGVRATVGDR